MKPNLGEQSHNARRRAGLATAAAGLWLSVAILLAVCVGCDRRPEPRRIDPPVAPAPSSTAGSDRQARPAPPPAERFRFAAARRVVAFGDVHGDLAATRAALRLAGAIDAQGAWIGADLVVVQTGDQIDRGDEDRQVLDLLDTLQAQARAAGGALHILNGNHETMNVQGDFRYVSRAALAAFADVLPTPNLSRLAERYPPEQRGRASAFLPGGPYARRLAQRQTVIVVGDTVFAHGGVLPRHVKRGIAKLNAEIRAWMNGQAPRPPRSVVSPDSPVWTRVYSDEQPEPGECKMLAKVLARLQARRLVVGHTVQRTGINAGCEGRVWRIDVGLAKHYGGRLEVLEIQQDRVRIVTPP